MLILPVRLNVTLALIAGVVAFLTSHTSARAQAPTQSLIEQLEQRLGLTEVQVRGALGALLVFVREELPKQEFDELARTIPNADRIMQDVKLQGIVTRPLDNIAEYEDSLAALGIGQPLASQFAPAVLDVLQTAGRSRQRDILARAIG